MSSDVIARLETLLNRVVSRRALPRTAAPDGGQGSPGEGLTQGRSPGSR